MKIMSNEIGSHLSDKGDDLPDQGKVEKRVDSGQKSDSGRLSLSDLISNKYPFPIKNASGNPSDFAQIVNMEGDTANSGKIKFDAKRTSDITKILHDSSIQRGLKSDSSLLGKVNQTEDFTWTSDRQLNASSNTGLFHPIGIRQHFNIKGIDTKKSEQDETPVRLMVDDFLKNTMINVDSALTPKSKEELEESTHSLARAESFEDVIASSIQLARLLRQMLLIEESKKAVMLAMGVDPDNRLANQMFKELERVHPPDIAISPAKSGLNQLNKATLAKRIVDLGKGRVSIVGDLLIDELLEGKPERISREAPVLILEHVDTLLIPGGAANTAHNITALGGQCHALGVCGDDEYQQKLIDMLASHNISCDLVVDKERPTTVKTRILSKSHSLMQQLLRLDRISHQKISSEIEEQLNAKIAKTVTGYHAVILSDYKAGAITDSVIKACRNATYGTKTMLVVDAQNRFERFSNCSLITPNQPDTESFLGFKIDSDEKLKQAGNKMLELSGAEAILITRGSEGMALFQKNEPQIELPVFNRSEVFDVTGAGDTVVATMTLALITGSSPLEAMALGNLAAGIVVKKSGTAITSQKEMLDTLETLDI